MKIEPNTTSILHDTQNLVSTGWLDPAGDFYHCPVMGHYAWAKEYLFDMKDAFDDHRSLLEKDAEQVLIDAGWVQITKSLFEGEEYSIFWSNKKSLTVYQENFLKPIFENKQLDISYASKYHWEKDCLNV